MIVILREQKTNVIFLNQKAYKKRDLVGKLYSIVKEEGRTQELLKSYVAFLVKSVKVLTYDIRLKLLNHTLKF